MRSYRKKFQPGAGYLPEKIAYISRTKSFTDLERWTVVTFDEMKIQCNFQFNKHSEKLIGLMVVIMKVNSMLWQQSEMVVILKIKLNVVTAIRDGGDN